MASWSPYKRVCWRSGNGGWGCPGRADGVAHGACDAGTSFRPGPREHDRPGTQFPGWGCGGRGVVAGGAAAHVVTELPRGRQRGSLPGRGAGMQLPRRAAARAPPLRTCLVAHVLDSLPRMQGGSCTCPAASHLSCRCHGISVPCPAAAVAGGGRSAGTRDGGSLPSQWPASGDSSHAGSSESLRNLKPPEAGSSESVRGGAPSAAAGRPARACAAAAEEEEPSGPPRGPGRGEPRPCPARGASGDGGSGSLPRWTGFQSRGRAACEAARPGSHPRAGRRLGPDRMSPLRGDDSEALPPSQVP